MALRGHNGAGEGARKGRWSNATVGPTCSHTHVKDNDGWAAHGPALRSCSTGAGEEAKSHAWAQARMHVLWPGSGVDGHGPARELA